MRLDDFRTDSTPDRAIVFIDGNNLYHRLKERGWPTLIEIGSLAKRVAGNRLLVRTYYYNAMPPSGPERTERTDAILAMLKGAPDIVFRQSRLQPIMEYDETGPYKSYVEKGADTAISADMVACAAGDEYEVAILISSDGDMEPTARLVSATYRKTVEVVYFKGHRPFAMESVALMREFRLSLIKELDRERRPRRPTRKRLTPS